MKIHNHNQSWRLEKLGKNFTPVLQEYFWRPGRKIAKTLRKWSQYLLAEADGDLFWPATIFTLQAVLCKHTDAAFHFSVTFPRKSHFTIELSVLDLAVETAISYRRGHSHECWKSCLVCSALYNHTYPDGTTCLSLWTARGWVRRAIASLQGIVVQWWWRGTLAATLDCTTYPCTRQFRVFRPVFL